MKKEILGLSLALSLIMVSVFLSTPVETATAEEHLMTETVMEFETEGGTIIHDRDDGHSVVDTNLTGSEHFPAIDTNTTGHFLMGYDPLNPVWAYFELRVWNGQAITAAHLHCAPVGEEGPVVAPIFGSIPGGFDFNGNPMMTATLLDRNIVLDAGCEETVGENIESVSDLISAVEEGNIYINVHSVEHPDGLIRGQLSATGNTANTNGDNLAPQNQTTGSIGITKHVCPETIQTMEDFDEIGGFEEKIALCPAVLLPGDEPSPEAVTGGQAVFNFVVEAFGGSRTFVEIDEAEFVQAEMCGDDLGNDLNLEEDECLDVSYYAYRGIPIGTVAVIEETSPTGTSFGSVEFAPADLDPADSSRALISFGQGIVSLDIRMAEDDVRLHIFNFSEEGSGANTENETPDQSEGVTTTNNDGVEDIDPDLLSTLSTALSNLMETLSTAFIR